jgi:FkbM family methyltransferase
MKSLEDYKDMKIIGFGADLTFGYCNESNPINISYFVDNDKNKHGSSVNGAHIYSPEKVLNETDKYVIIIFTTYFMEIKAQLESYGLSHGKDFIQFAELKEYYSVIDHINKEKDYLFLDKMIKPSYNCLDIGANVGLFSLKLSRLASEGQVYSFEPIPDTFTQLKKYVSMYNISNCQIFNAALVQNSSISSVDMIVPELLGSSRTGTAHIQTKQVSNQDVSDIKHFDNLFGHNIKPSDLNVGKHYKVKAITMDNIIKKLNPKTIDFIKCDVEGAEYSVMIGGEKSIRKYQPIIQCELGFDYVESASSLKLINYLKGMNYRLYYCNDTMKLVKIDESKLKEGEHNYYFLLNKHQKYYSQLINNQSV